jgi:hypothetical protein
MSGSVKATSITSGIKAAGMELLAKGMRISIFRKRSEELV